MKTYAAITVLVYCLFLVEFVLYNVFGSWGKPELVVLLIVFCNLYWGLRHGLWAAFTAGIIKDAFGIEPFGTYLFLFLLASFLSTIIRRNLYQPGSRFSRAVVAFLVLISIFLMEIVLSMGRTPIRFWEAFRYVLLPQLAVTMASATFVFVVLRNLAVRFKLTS